MRKFHVQYFIVRAFDAFRFAYKAFGFWMASDDDGYFYFAFMKYGIPVASCILAKGREAWRITNVAINNDQWRKM